MKNIKLCIKIKELQWANYPSDVYFYILLRENTNISYPSYYVCGLNIGDIRQIHLFISQTISFTFYK